MMHAESSFLLVEPNDILRSGLSCALAHRRRIQRITEVSDSARALAAAEREHFSIAILGAGISEAARYELLARLTTPSVQLGCIMILANVTWPEVQRATGSQALGILCMESSARELWAAIESIQSGKRFVCLALQQRLYESLRTGSTPAAGSIGTLTRREHLILNRIGAGESNREIAAELGLSRRTVDTHRTRLMRKLGVNKAAALVRFAVREGLIEA
jgi:DNA-binding NarL/FixJ family response regulator